MMKSDNWVRLPEWDGQDLRALLRLDRVGPQQFRNRYGDPNENGRSYGGQLLGQALMAASADVSPDRCATAMQFLFLQGAMHDQPLDIQVTALQDGKRFSSRHVRGVQPGGRVVLDAHVTFALPSPSPSHTESSTAQESPTTLVRLRDLPQEYTQRLNLLGGYSLVEKACMDFRLADAEVALTALQAPCARFWIRALMQTHEPRMHEGAFAYLSDFWLNFSSLGSHTQELAVNGRAIYVSSLNHDLVSHAFHIGHMASLRFP